MQVNRFQQINLTGHQRSAAPAEETSQISSSAEGSVDPKSLWLPTSEWAGRMVLPDESERREGGVYFEVRQTPKNKSHLKGKKLWLNFEKMDWVDRVTRDVDFSDRTKAGQEKGYQHPERIDGWDRVSPLESLAGARAQDDMVVALKDVRFDGQNLIIEREPVQISGTQKALVTFEKKIDAHTWEVRHWNRESNDFTGPKEIINTSGRDDLAPMKDRRLNRKGWYVYGDPGNNGKMTVAALEPRALFQVNTDQVIEGKKTALRYLDKESWRLEAQKKGEMTKTLLRPEPKDDGPTRPLTDQMKEAFKTGDRAILMHLFGGAVGAPGLFGAFLGHFAFGLAEVVQDPFTGEDKFDVEYKQIYAHNVGGIISGSQQWQTYMGDTERGWMYDRPVSDTIVKVPELFDDSHGQDPSKVLEQRLAEMTARYRSGHGDGSSQVTSAQNCSQDSSQALYATMSDWKQAISDGTIGKELTQFCEQLSGHITPIFGWAPRAWRRTANNKVANPKSFRYLPALKAYKTILPRENYEGLTSMALKGERDAMLFKTDTIGADNPQTVPAEPVQNLNPFD
jgi:predicted Abi (CAAX) family protease